MMTQEEVIHSPFFEGFPRAEVEALLKIGRERAFAAGEKILSEGEPAESFHLLIEGAVVLKMRADEHGELIVDTLRQTGEIFGWSALVEEGRSTATVECLQATRVLSFDGKEAEDLFLKNPALGYRFMRRLASLFSRRLERSRALLIKQIS